MILNIIYKAFNSKKTKIYFHFYELEDLKANVLLKFKLALEEKNISFGIILAFFQKKQQQKAEFTFAA